ncbi:MAG: hypothetical protein EXR94_07115 [Gemmatimonadetes bacterium]|nr:hypothetical protein [Gemmatimonadota bacterium]
MLETLELGLPIRDRDPVALLDRKSHRGFDRAVTTPDHQNPLALVGFGIEEAVHHVGKLFAGDAELVGGTAAPNRHEHHQGMVFTLGRPDGETAHRIPEHGLDRFFGSHVEPPLLGGARPDGQEVFFGNLTFGEFPVERKLDRARHHQFLARILGHRPAEIFSFQGDEAETTLGCPE